MTKEEEKYEYEVYQIQMLGAERWLAEKIYAREKWYKKGLWQYMIDHHYIEPSGDLKVMFHVRSKQDFLRRVQARVDGEFQRYDREEVENNLTTVANLYRHLKNLNKMQKDAEFSKNLFIRIIARLYRRYVLKKKTRKVKKK